MCGDGLDRSGCPKEHRAESGHLSPFSPRLRIKHDSTRERGIRLHWLTLRVAKLPVKIRFRYRITGYPLKLRGVRKVDDCEEKQGTRGLVHYV